MFNGFSQETSDFLWGLAFNNERPWFLVHKSEYEEYLLKPFKALAQQTAEIMNSRYPDMGLNLHAARIYRDARRLHGRGPYKDHLWFSMKNWQGLLAGPMFWFEIGAADHSRGMGFYSSSPAQMDIYRAAIDANPAKLERLVERFNAQDKFTFEGETYKRLKKDVGPLLNPWYNCKHFALSYSDNFGGELFDPDLPRIIADDFEFLMPYYEYLMSINWQMN